MGLGAAAGAQGGVLMRPHLVLDATGKSGTSAIDPEVMSRVTSPGIASVIGSAMRLAVAGEIGQAFTAGANVRGLAVAGKSGTAELDTGQSPHSWFIGFAPVE